MYERKTPENLDCGINISMKVFGGKWKPCIIDAIGRGIKRPSEIYRDIREASLRVIEMQLKELEEYGIVSKKNSGGYPLHVEYTLTKIGESILPIIDMLLAWGNNNKDIFQPAVAEQQN
jgi:DNA-binding HxlR family transcriptional regulator